jgi:hypothetical protein
VIGSYPHALIVLLIESPKPASSQCPSSSSISKHQNIEI